MPHGRRQPTVPTAETSSRIPEKVPQVGWKVMGKSVHSGQDVFSGCCCPVLILHTGEGSVLGNCMGKKQRQTQQMSFSICLHM